MRTCWMERRQRRDAQRTPPRAALAGVTMPMGPAAAAEAIAWLNRQLSWQSQLAELEGVSWLRQRARTN
jgi:hypothetical protein